MTSSGSGNPRGGRTVVGFVAGLLAGVLIAALAVPDRQTTVRSSAAGATGTDELAVGDAGASVAGGAESSSGAGAASVAKRAASSAGNSRGRAATGTGGGGASEQSVTSARGVSSTSIKIGVALLDLGPLKNLGPQYDTGDPQQQWDALLDGWKRQGKLPVNGRTIEFIYQNYSPLDASQQRSACVSLVQDQKVFAVTAIAAFPLGAECVAREFRTPLMTSDGPSDEVFARSDPFLFSLSMSSSRTLRNWMYWAENRGLLRGKKIGLYYQNDPDTGDQVNRSIKAALTKLGYTVTSEATSGNTQGGPEDALAVQRFQAAGVNLAVLMVSKTGFMQQAEAQGYRPKYIESDYLFGTDETAASNYPTAQFDGTFAMTDSRQGEQEAGMPKPPEQTACVANYERYAGKKVETHVEEGFIRISCDVGGSVLLALQRAGRNLTPASLVSALETIRQYPSMQYSPLTFTPAKHHGAELQRTIQFFAACKCFKAVSPFAPMFVP